MAVENLCRHCGKPLPTSVLGLNCPECMLKALLQTEGCKVLQFAHEHGVIRCDIKPENILLDKPGCVKIADFGIAKMVGGESRLTNLTDDEQVTGTPHSIAPAQVEKPQEVDHRADIYSLGVVFHEMLTGELAPRKFQPPYSTPNHLTCDAKLLSLLR